MAVEPGRISLRRKTPGKRRSFSHRRREEEEEEEEEKEKCSEETQRQSPVADDEAEIYDVIRAAFPLSFGKQSKSQTSLEAIHNTTRRSVTNKPPEKPSSDAVKTNGLPSLSPSSQTWLSSLRTPKNLNPDPNSNENDDGDAMVGPPPPPPQSDLGDDNDDERDMIGPPRPPAGSSRDDSDSEANFENRFRIPLSNEIVLKGHTKVVSALAVDHTGSRVVSGSYDYSVRMYDFQGMNSKLQSFRQLEPSEGHQVRTISWSPTADRFLCVTGSATAKIYDRDGLTLGEFVKGDMYIRDLKNTKGHISGLTCGEWNPESKDTILTSSEDGSLRIWDVNDYKTQKKVIKPKLARPGRVPVTTCAWDRDGKRIAGGIGDGSMYGLNLKPGWGILLSRSLDGTLKVCDFHQMKDPLKAFEDLPNNHAQTNIAFSPDEQLFLTGTSVERRAPLEVCYASLIEQNLNLFQRLGYPPRAVLCSVPGTQNSIRSLQHQEIKAKEEFMCYMIQRLVKEEPSFVLRMPPGKSLLMILRQNQ